MKITISLKYSLQYLFKKVKFCDFVEQNGVGAMELVALDLKCQGIFLARQLSFEGATFEIKEIEMEREYVEIYDRSVRLVS